MLVQMTFCLGAQFSSLHSLCLPGFPSLLSLARCSFVLIAFDHSHPTLLALILSALVLNYLSEKMKVDFQ